MYKGSLTDWVALCISSTGFSGFVPGWIWRKPKGGGMAGTIMALPLQGAALHLHLPLGLQLVAAIGTLLIGWASVEQAEQFMLERWGKRRRHTGEEVTHDFNETNIDEFHGQFVAGLALWIGPPTAHDVALLGLAFILFRVFDAYKTGPVKAVEMRFKGTALGIMIDDTVAGLMTACIVGFVKALILLC